MSQELQKELFSPGSITVVSVLRLCGLPSVERHNERTTDIRRTYFVDGYERPGFLSVIRRKGNPGNNLFYGLGKLEDFDGELDPELLEPAGVHHDGQVVLPEDGNAAGIGSLLEYL